MILGVAIGSALGAVLRYALERVHAHIREHRPHWLLHPDLPWATLTVNVIGSGVLGWVSGLAAAGALGEATSVWVGAGLAGGLTTFSTFVVDTLALLRGRRWRLAGAYVVANLALGTAVAAAAYHLA